MLFRKISAARGFGAQRRIRSNASMGSVLDMILAASRFARIRQGVSMRHRQAHVPREILPGLVDLPARANCLPYLMELSYACVRRQASYSVFGAHCRSRASTAL